MLAPILLLKAICKFITEEEIMKKLILTISIILSGITQHAPQVIAQTQKPTVTKKPSQPATKPPSSKKTPSQTVYTPKPPKNLTPISGRRTGMGSRDSCPAVNIPLTALAPFQQQQQLSTKTNKSSIGIVGGLTTLEKPSFLFYVPYTQNLTGSNAEFSLLDSKGTDVHRIKTALPPKPGIIKISLPNTVSLQLGQTYQWYFKVRCNGQKASLPMYVEGYIQRSNLDSRVTEQLKTAANPQQKATIYAKEGIWFDALNMLAQIRQSSQNASVEEDWQSLLRSVNLDGIATAPLVNSTNQQ